MTKKQARGEETKNRILRATINVIKEQGMRAVRHRSVAAEAGVPLGSTTYYFKSIEDLISSTFIYWHQQIDVGKNPHFISIQNELINIEETRLTTQKGKQFLADTLYQDSIRYLTHQIFEHADDRIVELSFHNEALRNPKLSSLLLQSWNENVSLLTQLFQALQADSPEIDAEITSAIIFQFEKKAMLITDLDCRKQEVAKMKLVLKKHIYTLMGII